MTTSGSPDRTTGPDDFDARRNGHILQELGFSVAREGTEARGWAPIVPEMWVPGTSSMHASILAAWADVASGYVAIEVLAPRVPVTLELDLHLYRPAPADGTVHITARALKTGRAVIAIGFDFTDQDGEPVAVGTSSFMAAPDPNLRLPADLPRESLPAPDARLEMPFVERARCTRPEPGVAVLHRSDDNANASDTLNGGLLALAVEEAALSRTPGTTLADMSLRFLRPLRVGPAVATSQVRSGLGRVEVRDAGSDDRLAIVATTRTFSDPARA
jgi:acyl-coenzyme A thioesterase PaaI-like protein